MKTALRWILVLPAAAAGMIIVNLLNSLTVAHLFPSSVGECVKSWFGSRGMILAVYHVAPKGKAITATILSSAYCAIGLFGVIIALRVGDSQYPNWLLVVTTLLTITACVLGCAMAYSMEKQNEKENLHSLQKN